MNPESEQSASSVGPTREEFSRLQKLLTETAEAVKENRHILHQMRFWGRVAFVFKVIAWGAVLIGVPFLISTFLPVLNGVFHGALGSYGTTSSSTSLFGLPSPTEFQHALGH